MKPLGWLCFFLLSGCVVIDDRHFEFTQYSSTVDSKTDASQYTHTEQAVPASKPQIIIKTLPAPTSSAPSEVAANGQQVKSGCKPFILPTAAEQPLPPALTDTKMSSEQMDAAVAQYVKDLRTYITTERQALKDSYDEWLQGCKN